VEEVRTILIEAVLAVVPFTLVIVLLDLCLVRMPSELLVRFLAGAAMVLTGLFLFLLGVRVGLLPLGEAIGADLPNRGSLLVMMVVGFVIALAVTVAEPDVRVLAYQVDLVSGGRIPGSTLILSVALGVGVFVALALLRIVLGIPIAYLLASGYVLVVVLSFFAPAAYVPVAFDAGGVTTGPLTVPFILALGIGTASVLGGRSSLSDGFGLIGLASIGPVIGVMILGVIFG
jgi:hypothetical protein